MAIQARLKKEKEDRKRLILNNALILFRKNGLSGTTVRQIEKASNLAVGTIYIYFGDKNQIFCALLLEGYDLLISHLKETPQAGSGKNNIENGIDRYFSFAFANPEYFNLIFYTVQSNGQGVLDLADKESKTYEELKKRKERCLIFVKEYVRGIRGDLSGKELENTAEVTWSMLAGVILFFSKDDKKRFDIISQQAKKMIVNSLLSI
ncbi:MAG: TetR/AcrR family transcriptional regulator [Victivallaceae bacterium]|nr:TetR/AcrR family transcriptional regulator [Victivallaceae bacterium]